MKAFWIALIIITATIIIVFIHKSFFSTKHIAEIINNNKNHYSIILAEDNQILININPDEIHPLASVVKLIIAIEFSEQIITKDINKNELILLSEIEKYHIPYTDGNAHRDWLKHIIKNDKIINDNAVNLWEVARGMIAFSSNANTEYLLDKLGIENVNHQLEKLEFKKHTKINFLVAELYLSKYELLNNTDDDLYKKTILLHEEIKSGKIKSKEFDYKNGITLEKQKLLNERMTSSTALEYYNLIKKIRSKTFFPKEVQDELNNLIERKSDPNKYDITRFGGKGGSTIWTLNNAIYLERKNGKKYEFILFSNYPTDNNDNYLISKRLAKLTNEITNDTKQAKKLIKIINK